MIKKVLFATDLSAPSRKVLKYAARFCTKTGASLVGTYAFEAPRALQTENGLKPDELGKLKDQYRSRLQSFFTSPDLSDVDVTLRMAFGIPQEAISELLMKEDADLSIVGKHGRSALERFFLGSNTEKILRLARKPVLVVPPEANQTVEWNPLCCAVDFSRTSKEALSLATRLCDAYESSLRVIHGVEMGASFDESENDLEEKLKSAVEERRRRLLPLLDSAGAPQGSEVDIDSGKTAQFILRSVETSNTDLLIMGIRGKSNYSGLGSVSSAVLRGIDLPVLLVPGR